MTTLLALRNRVKANTGMGTSDATIDSIIDAGLCQAQKVIGSAIGMLDLQRKITVTTSAGQGSYSIDSDFKIPDFPGHFMSIIHLKETTIMPLMFLTSNQWDNEVLHRRTQTGTPLYYTIWNRNVEIWNVPDTAYNLQLKYVALPTNPVNDTDTFILQNCDDAIVAMGTAFTFYSLEQYNEADKWSNMAQLLMGADKHNRSKIHDMRPNNKNQKYAIWNNPNIPFK